MTRHSRNNTAGAFFTSSEKNKLTQYGSQKQRLGKESMRRPDSCVLCLQTAVDPLICTHGHLFCRECILKNVVAQKQLIAEKLKAYERELREKEQAAIELEEISKRRKIEEFENNLFPKHISLGKDETIKQKSSKEAARRGGSEASAFWVPSKTPSTKIELPEPNKEIQCPATNDHSLTIKQLVSIRWSRSDADGSCICGICSKNYIPGMRIVAIKCCGHSFCSKCMTEVAAAGDLRGEGHTGECSICSKPYEDGKDLITLVSEGTGFSGSGGRALAVKYDHAFV